MSLSVLTRPDVPSSAKAGFAVGDVQAVSPSSGIFQPVAVGDWIKSCPVVSPSYKCADLVTLFRQKKELECVVVCDEAHFPQGLIMKYRFFRLLGSLYGMSLFGHKSVAALMDEHPLRSEADVEPQQLIDRALSRDESTFYDAVIVSKEGKFAGILTVNDLLNVSRLLQKKADNQQILTIRHTESMIEGIHQSVENVAASTHDTQACSERIAEIADQGRDQLAQMLQLFRLWSDTADRQDQAIAQLTERTSAAESIIRLISELADQCNLLAVNASIEAARAGAHGRGFGVVASEIRALADQTKQSAVQINRHLKSMTEAVGGAAALVREGKNGADRGFAQVKRTEDTFAQLWSSSTMNKEAADRLNRASDEAKAISGGIRKEFHKLIRQMNGEREI